VRVKKSLVKKMHGRLEASERDGDVQLPDGLPILTAEHSLEKRQKELLLDDLQTLEDILPDLTQDVLNKLDLPVFGRVVSTARRTIAGEEARIESHVLKGVGSSSGLREVISKVSSSQRQSVAQDLANHHLLQFAAKLQLSSKSKAHGQRFVIPFLGTRMFKHQIYHYMPKGESAFDYVQNEWFQSAQGFQETRPRKQSLPTAEWSWEKRVAQWSAELIAGLQYIHDLGFSHNDVKLENVVLVNAHACLIDFDSMTQFGAVTTNEMMTKPYCSRETKSGKYCPKLNDTYSLGICIFMMLFAHQPERSEFHDLTSGSYSRKPEGRKGCLVDYVQKLGRKRLVSEPAFDFLKCVLCPEGERRSLEELANHPWILENSSLPNAGTDHSHCLNHDAQCSGCAEDVSASAFGIVSGGSLPSELSQGVDLALDGSRTAIQGLLSNFRMKPSKVLMPLLHERHPELARSLRIEYYYQHLSEKYSDFCKVPAFE